MKVVPRKLVCLSIGDGRKIQIEKVCVIKIRMPVGVTHSAIPSWGRCSLQLPIVRDEPQPGQAPRVSRELRNGIL